MFVQGFLFNCVQATNTATLSCAMNGIKKKKYRGIWLILISNWKQMSTLNRELCACVLDQIELYPNAHP